MKKRSKPIEPPDEFDKVFIQMNNDEQMELFILSSIGYFDGNVRMVGFETLRREQEYRLKMVEKYAPNTPYAAKVREDYEQLITIIK